MRRYSINTPVVEPDIASEREHLGGYHERALSRGFASGADVEYFNRPAAPPAPPADAPSQTDYPSGDSSQEPSDASSSMPAPARPGSALEQALRELNLIGRTSWSALDLIRARNRFAGIAARKHGQKVTPARRHRAGRRVRRYVSENNITVSGDVFVGATGATGGSSSMKDAVSIIKYEIIAEPTGDEEEGVKTQKLLINIPEWNGRMRFHAHRAAYTALARKRGHSSPTIKDKSFARTWMYRYMRNHGIKAS